MSQTLTNADPKPEVIQELRNLADRGVTVRQLVAVIQTRIGLKEDALLPVLWYFMNAFSLTLAEVLPLREWLGSSEDKEIDSIILPAIEKARGR
jgi:hypothetical protein